MAVYVIVNTRTGEVERGYTARSAENAIAWAWNTGGEIDHLRICHEPEIPSAHASRQSESSSCFSPSDVGAA